MPTVQNELELARAEAAHWKANHDSQVQRARFLIERGDIPVERVRAYETMGQYHAALQAAAHAAGLLPGADTTRELVPRIWLLRELLWNADQWAIYHKERLPFGELIAEHGGLSTEHSHGNV